MQWGAMELAEDILHAAQDFAHDKEVLEKEHRDSAHASLTKVLLEEDLLERMDMKVHKEEDEFLEESLHGTYIEDDDQKLWAMGVVESYLENRIEKAHMKEEALRKEEEEANHALHDLEKWENELEATLEEIDHLKHEKNLKDWTGFDRDETGGASI